VVTSRVGFEFGQPDDLTAESARLSVSAILHAIFGD
jgi:hypothetical protein